MILNLALRERRVLMLLQQDGLNDVDEIADRLHIPLHEARNAVATLAEEDLVETPDQTVAELTDRGRNYDLLCDESIEDEFEHLKGCRVAILRYIHETGRQPVTIGSLAQHFDRSEGAIAEALDALEELGYPVRNIVS